MDWRYQEGQSRPEARCYPALRSPRANDRAPAPLLAGESGPDQVPIPVSATRQYTAELGPVAAFGTNNDPPTYKSTGADVTV